MTPPIDRLCIKALAAEDEAEVKRLTKSLTQFGFAIIRMESPSESRALKAALQRCEDMGNFRFPPTDEPVRYEEMHVQCFKALFKITRYCLKALLASHPGSPEAAAPLLNALEESFSPQYKLFSEPGETAGPFCDDEAAFGTSFLNIFHYDHGLLNAHRDRCLVTAIFVHQDKGGDVPKSALWVKGGEGEWLNADALVAEDEVVILLGDELAELAESIGLPVWAAEHCIRVDPNGPDLAHAHQRPDPDTPSNGNRISAALILSH